MSTAKEELARLIQDQPDDRSAEEIVRERFARGEIDEQEYEERLEALSSGGRPGARGMRSP